MRRSSNLESFFVVSGRGPGTLAKMICGFSPFDCLFEVGTFLFFSPNTFLNDRDILVAMRNGTLTQIWRFGIHQCYLKRQLPLTDAAARRRRSGALIPAVQDAEYLI